MTTPTENIIDPDRPIIDPHHHLWDWPTASRDNVPFPDHGFTQVLLQKRRYLLDDLLGDIHSSHNVFATVFIETKLKYHVDGPKALYSVGETEFANSVAARPVGGSEGDVQACAGIVGHVDLRLGGEVEDALQAHLTAGGERFRGIRHSASYDADDNVLGPIKAAPEGLYLDSAFRSGFARLHQLGLTFDAWVLEPQLPEVLDLARAYPETTIILNHLGTPLGIGRYRGARDHRFDNWRDAIQALATCENVFVKLGGLAMPFLGFEWSCTHRPDHSTDLARVWAPYIETGIEAFGCDRCMFESNFPVDFYSCNYAQIWNAFKHVTQNYSEPEKTALFSGTAARVYNLDTDLRG